MVNKPETAIRSRIHAWIKLKGGTSWTVHGSPLQSAGQPDIDGWIPDPRLGFIHLKLEVKTSSGVPAKNQIAWLNTYKRGGYCAGVVRSVDDVQSLVKAYRRRYGE